MVADYFQKIVGPIKKVSSTKITVDVLKPIFLETMYGLTRSPIKQDHRFLGKSMESCLILAGPVYLRILVCNCDTFVT